MLREFIKFLISEGVIPANGKKPANWSEIEDFLPEEKLIFYQSIFFGKPYSVEFEFGNEDLNFIKAYPEKLFTENLIIPVKSSMGTVLICFNYGQLLDNDTINLFSRPEIEVLLIPASEITHRLEELFISRPLHLTSCGLTLKDVRKDNTGISLLHYTMGLLVNRTDYFELKENGGDSILSYNGINRRFCNPFYKLKLRFEAFFYSRNMEGENSIPLDNGGALHFYCSRNSIIVLRTSGASLINPKEHRRLFYFITSPTLMAQFEMDKEQIEKSLSKTGMNIQQIIFCEMGDFIKHQFTDNRLIGCFYSETANDVEMARQFLKKNMTVSFKEVLT